jgi:hypothetical protein
MELDTSPLPSREILAKEVLKVLAQRMRPLNNAEIVDAVGDALDIQNDRRPSKSEKDGRTDFAYILAWIRSDLKKKDLVQLHKNGTWEITGPGLDQVGLS